MGLGAGLDRADEPAGKIALIRFLCYTRIINEKNRRAFYVYLYHL